MDALGPSGCLEEQDHSEQQSHEERAAAEWVRKPRMSSRLVEIQRNQSLQHEAFESAVGVDNSLARRIPHSRYEAPSNVPVRGVIDRVENIDLQRVVVLQQAARVLITQARVRRHANNNCGVVKGYTLHAWWRKLKPRRIPSRICYVVRSSSDPQVITRAILAKQIAFWPGDNQLVAFVSLVHDSGGHKVDAQRIVLTQIWKEWQYIHSDPARNVEAMHVVSDINGAAKWTNNIKIPDVFLWRELRILDSDV